MRTTGIHRLPALGHVGDRHAEQAAIRQAVKGHAEAGRDVADGVERAIVGDDLDDVVGTGAGQPHPGRNGDPQVAPVADADGRRAMDELRAVTREQARGVVADHAPVADREELRAAPVSVHRQMSDHTGDVLGAARVLDVEEDGPPAHRQRPLGRRGCDASGKRRLGDRERDRRLAGRDFGDGSGRWWCRGRPRTGAGTPTTGAALFGCRFLGCRHDASLGPDLGRRRGRARGPPPVYAATGRGAGFFAACGR
jgi:hypothetical protein